MAAGVFSYTAFVVDALAGRVVGWECSASKETRFVEPATRQAAAFREREGNPPPGHTIRHSDAGSRYTSVRSGGPLLLAGTIPSAGTVGGAYDDALAETTIGLCKNERVRADPPVRTGPLNRLSDAEEAAAGWAHRYNTGRLAHRLDRKPPAGYEASYRAEIRDGQPAGHTQPRVHQTRDASRFPNASRPSTNDGSKNMYAVIAIFRSRQPEATDPATTYLREHIVPNVSAEPGFVAVYWTHDGQRNYNTLVFDTREAAERRAADVRGNAANQAAFGIVMETVVVAEVIAHAEAPRG